MLISTNEKYHKLHKALSGAQHLALREYKVYGALYIAKVYRRY